MHFVFAEENIETPSNEEMGTSQFGALKPQENSQKSEYFIGDSNLHFDQISVFCL